MSMSKGRDFTAIIHYAPNPVDAAVIKKDQVRVDSIHGHNIWLIFR